MKSARGLPASPSSQQHTDAYGLKVEGIFQECPGKAGTFLYSSENAVVSKAKTQRKFTFFGFIEADRIKLSHTNEKHSTLKIAWHCVYERVSVNDFNYAGFWRRWLAQFIDGIIMFIANFIVGIGLGLLLGISALFMGLDKAALDIVSTTAGFLLGLLSQWLYFALMESSECQATLGKRICKLKVTDTEGQRLSFQRATGRYWAKWLSTLTCLVGYVMAAFTERKQALHDMIASTLVLRQTD